MFAVMACVLRHPRTKPGWSGLTPTTKPRQATEKAAPGKGKLDGPEASGAREGLTGTA
jgi:hypothetical protein